MRRAPTACLVFVVAVAMSVAEDPPIATGQGSKAVADPLDAARREFDAVQRNRANPAQPRSGLPRIAVPEYHPVAPAGEPRPGSASSKMLPEKKSANWLVDAMQPEARERGARAREARGSDAREQGEPEQRGRSRRPFDPDVKSGNRGDSADATEPRSSERVLDQGSAPEAEPSAGRPPGDTPVFNPLAQYLGEWMSPRDYTLLGVPLQERAAGRDSLLPGPGSVPGASDSIGAAAAPGRASSRGPVVLPTPDANPFLQALNVPPTSSTAPAVSPPPRPPPIPAALPPSVTAPASVAPASTLAPTTAPAPRIPDFAKRAEEEKHFKPLKRF